MVGVVAVIVILCFILTLVLPPQQEQLRRQTSIFLIYLVWCHTVMLYVLFYFCYFNLVMLQCAQGCGFVEFSSTEEAERAFALDGKDLLGRCVFIMCYIYIALLRAALILCTYTLCFVRLGVLI